MTTPNTPMTGLPTLLDQLFAAQAARQITPTNQPVSFVLPAVTLSDIECADIDMAHHHWKQNGGPVREHDARAEAFELRSRRMS